MEEDTKKKLQADPDGLLTYEYIANHIDTVEPDLSWLVDNMQRVDLSGQFVISAASISDSIPPRLSDILFTRQSRIFQISILSVS